MGESSKSHLVLALNTLAFTVCFACWMLNGVLVTFLVDNQVFKWGPVEIGWLLGIPVLTGSLFRFPAGILTDKFGGKWVYGLLLLLSAIPMYFLSTANGFMSFALLSFGFGLTGTSFAIGIAFTSVWYSQKWQGTALGIFGTGNAGAALTTLFAPTLLQKFTQHGADIEGWRMLPKVYAAALVVMGVLYLLFTTNRRPRIQQHLRQMLVPLKDVRVWRFGLYYFLVFGCFVALSQWLVPYFLNVYSVTLVTAGLFASLFSFPSGVIRALGGFLSDKLGARNVMYWVLGLSTACCLLLIVPKMEIFSPGSGVLAKRAGKVVSVSPDRIVVDEVEYSLTSKGALHGKFDKDVMVFPEKDVWHEPVVAPGDRVAKKQLLARGQTRIFFQANMWIALTLIFIVGIVWGIGKAAVYKHIPEYFPNSVGVVGGTVGVIGGLGGFFSPIIFGYLLKGTGLWTSMWMFLAVVSLGCLVWMNHVVKKLSHRPRGFESKFAGLKRVVGGDVLLPLMVWSPEYSVANDTMDSQHKRLMGYVNDLDRIIRKGGNYEELAPLFEALIDYTKTHFVAEEKMLVQKGYPDLEKHRELHADLISDLFEFRKNAERGDSDALGGLMVFLKTWFTGHILEEDKKYEAHFKTHS